MGFGGPVAISMDAIFRTMGRFDIPEYLEWDIYDRVQGLAKHMIKKQHDEAEAERERNKGQ